MNRTAEMMLTFLGFIIYSLFVIIGGFTVWMYHNEARVEEMLQDVEQVDDGLSKNEFLQSINEIGSSGWYIAIGSAIALIAGAVAIFFLRRSRNVKVAGYTLIISAILTTIGTFGLAFLGGIIYLIAGIMCLVRKPKDVFI